MFTCFYIFYIWSEYLVQTTHTHTHKDPTCFSKKEIILEIFLAFFLKFFDFFWKFRKTTFSGILKCLCGGDAEAKPPHGSSTRTRARAPALLREYGRTLFWTRSRSSRSRRWMYYFFASERRFTWVYMFFLHFLGKKCKKCKKCKNRLLFTKWFPCLLVFTFFTFEANIWSTVDETKL